MAKNKYDELMQLAQQADRNAVNGSTGKTSGTPAVSTQNFTPTAQQQNSTFENLMAKARQTNAAAATNQNKYKEANYLVKQAARNRALTLQNAKKENESLLRDYRALDRNYSDYSGWATDEMSAAQINAPKEKARQEILDRYSRNNEIIRAAEEERKAGIVDNRTSLQKGVDRILGVDRTQVTGEKTNWGKLAVGDIRKGLNQWNNAGWKTINFLFGDAAEEIHTLGTETINRVIEGLNAIPGVDIDYLGKSRNLIQFMADDAERGLNDLTEYYAPNANSSRAAQIVDQFGTGAVAAMPMALEAILIAPAKLAQAAAVTTEGLTGFAGLQAAQGAEAIGLMAQGSMKKLLSNPQFWSSYLQVAGSGYEDALQDGMNEEDAAIYGLVNGFFNAMLEIGGGDEAMGGVQNMPMRLAEARKEGNKRAVVSWFKDAMLQEGKEEVEQGIMERGLKSFFGQDVPIASLNPNDTDAILNPYTSLQEFTGGAVIGGLLGGGQVATDYAVNGSIKAVQEAQQYEGDTELLIEQAKQANEQGSVNAEAAETIAKIEKKAETKGGVTLGEARKLYQIIEDNNAVETFESAAKEKTVSQDLDYVFGTENKLDPSAKKVLTDGFDSRISSVRQYTIGVKDAYMMGSQGFTLEQTIQNSQYAAQLHPDQIRHAWQLGRSMPVTGTGAVDINTEEGKARLQTSLKALGKYSDEAMTAYEEGQDVSLFGAAMDKLVNMYGANGADLMQVWKDARSGKTNDIIGTLTEAQVKMAQQISEQVQQDKAADVKARAEQLQAKAKAQAEGKVQQREKGTVRFDGGVINGVELKGVDQASLNRQQKNVVAMVERLADFVPIDYVFFSGKESAAAGSTMVQTAGVYLQGGTVYINLDATTRGTNKMLAAATLSHELTHFMQQYAPEEYALLKDYVVKTILKKSPAQFDALVRQQQKLEPGKTYDQLVDELVANACQTMLMDDKAVTKMARENMTLAQKVADVLEDIQQKIHDAVDGLDISQGNQFAPTRAVIDEIDAITDLWVNGIGKAVETYKAVGSEVGEAQYMKVGERDDGIEVYETSEEIKKLPWKEKRKRFLDLMNDEYRGRTAKFTIGDDVYYAKFAGDDIRKTIYGDKKSDDAGRDAKINAGADGDIFDLVENASYLTSEPERGKKTRAHRNVNRWDYFVKTVQIDGRVFDLLANVRKKQDGDFVYSLQLTLNDNIEAASPDALPNKGELNGAPTASDNNIAETAGEVKKEIDVGSANLEVDTGTDSIDIQYSLLTWEESDYVTDREKAAEDIAKAVGVSKKKALDYIDSVNAVARMIADDKVRLDYADTGRSPFVSNAEYGGSFDFTTLCKKRRLLTGTFSAIQKALANTALTANEILEIRKMMDDAGLEVSCGKCYVEGSRASMGIFTKEFLELYKKYNPGKWVPNMAQMNTPDGIEWVRQTHPEVYEQYEYFWNHYGTLKPGDPNLFASQQKPKLYQMRSAYKGEVLQHFKRDSSIEEKNRNGGVRMQSFSDFEIVHLIDAMQVIMDMSRVGLNGQAYTKVPDFAWALGHTGLKINLSIDAWSVDENGKLVFNNKEGMNFDEAMRIRAANSENVGTICCVYDDAQLLAALADDRIDFIIPFHRSQWKKSQYKAMGLPQTTKDYTYQQNEKWLDPSKHTHEYHGKQVKDKCFNYMPNEYWDFTKSGKENAEEYLRMCARDGKRPKFYKFLDRNADGSFSLKKDGSTDGYWKLLIDFKMYDNDGKGSPQLPVKPNFNMDEVNRMLTSYEGGHSQFPVAQGIVDEFVEKYKTAHPDQVQFQKVDDSIEEDFSSEQEPEAQYSKFVDDEYMLDFLNEQVKNGEVVHTYKTFLEIVDEDGTVHLYPPMASMQRDENGKLKMAHSMEVGRWEESVGNPNSKGIISKTNKKGETKWYYRLVKDNGKTVDAAYDPYQHSSDVVLNDQFEEAYQRPNLVTYECLIPQSDINSGYWYRQARDDGQIVEAALPAGKHSWKKGTVAGKLKNTERAVYLTKYLMPYRRLSDAEVAQQYKEILDREDTQVSVPFNVVPPGLLAELEKAGVSIDYKGSPGYQYRQNKKAGKQDAQQQAQFQKTEQTAPEIEQRILEGDSLRYEVKTYFRHISERNANYLSPEKIDELMEVNPYGTYVRGDMNDADEVLMALSAIAKSQKVDARAETFELMDKVLQHLSTIQKENWVSEKYDVKDKAFQKWYNKKHPSLYYPGYKPGDLNQIGNEFKELNYLETLMDQKDIPERDRLEAQELYNEIQSGRQTMWYQLVDMSDEDTETEKSGRELAYARLQNENAILKETVKTLKRTVGKQKTTLANIQKQLQISDPEVRKRDAEKLAKALISEANSTADFAKIAAEIKAFGDYMLQTPDFSEQTLKNKAREIAREIIQGATENVTLDEDTMTVNPYEQYMGEATEEMANRIVMDAVTGILRPVQATKADKQKSMQQTLKDQLRQLREENKLNQKEAATLYETINTLTEQLDRAQSQYETLRQEAEYRTAQVRAEGAARAAEIRAYERARSKDLLEEQKQHYLDIARRAKARREESAGATKYRKQVIEKAGKLYEMMLKNDDKVHVPEVLKQPLGELLESISFESKRSLAGGAETQADQKFGARLMKLQQMLENQQRYLDGDTNAGEDLGGYIDVAPEMMDYLRNTSEMITTAMNTGRTFTINQMSAEDLKTLSNFLGNLRTAINNMNRFMANARYETVREAAAEDIQNMKQLGSVSGLGTTAAAKLATWQNGTPYYIFKRYGKGGEAIFDGLTRGWEKLAFNAREIINFTEDLYTNKEVKDWTSEIHDITLEDGTKIQITTGQIMSLAMLINREQALKHMNKGGARIGDIQQKGVKGTIQDLTQHHFTDTELQKIIGTLTARQLEVAQKLQKYMATKGAEWGNEISMRRFGYNFYEEGENYFPIRTMPTDRPMADTDAQQNSMFRLLNLSASKSLNPKANNALVIDDIFDVFSDHMADMAKLNGMGLPILDAIKWFNYKEKLDNGDGTFNTETMQAAMQTAFGDQAGKYFKTLIKDINGMTESGDRGTNLPTKLLSNYKIAAVAANLRVALLQPTAYVRAMTVLSPKYMIGNIPTKAAYEEALKYSGTAGWKDLGYYETDISRGLREKIKHDDTVRDKIAEASMKPAEFGDQMTWATLWQACKRQAKAQNPDAIGNTLMQKTADLFREVVYSSQVMDSTLTRSEIMRGKTMFTKGMSAFMAEPTLSYNILMDAFSKYNLDVRKNGGAGAWQRNSKTLGRALAVYACSAAFAAVVESIADAFRDDDDEDFLEKFTQAFFGEDGKILTGNFAQDLSVLGKLPYVKNIFSKLQGYQSTDMSVAALGNVWDAYKIWEETIKLANGELDKATKTTYYGKMTEWGKIYKTLQALSQLSGIAVSNATRDAIAIWNTLMNGRRDDWKIRTYDGGKGDSEEDKIRNSLLKGKMTEQEAVKALMGTGKNSKISQITVDKWRWEQETGVQYSKLDDAYKAGEITRQQAVAGMKAAGKSDKDIQKALEDYDFEKKYGTEYEGYNLTTAQAKAYYNNGLQNRISLDEYAAQAEEYGTTVLKGYYGGDNPGFKSIEDYAVFQSIPVHSDKKGKAAELVVSSGINVQQYASYLESADTDGNGSVKQDELGAVLKSAISRNEITQNEAEKIWYTLWQSKNTFAKWASKH